MEIKRLFPIEKRKFVLSIGDEGAILVLINGSALEQRMFINSPSAPELKESLSKYPNAPVSILVDVLDQAFIQHTLPPVSALNIGKIVKRRLEKDFSEQDIKAARKLFREKSGRKDWNYLFVSVSNTPPFSDWVDFISEVKNPFDGIYLLPVEMENFLKKIVDFDKDKSGKKTPWKVLVSHNRVGGFRQIVFRDDKVLFTRIAQPIGGLAPDVIAGNIEQETLNTIEYIRRLGFENSSELDVYIIASQEVKAALEDTALEARVIKILTPFEIAENLKLANAAEKTDRFGDVVIACSFATSGKVLKLNTAYTTVLEKITNIHRMAYVATFILIPLLIILSGVYGYDIRTLNQKIEEVEIKKIEAQEEFEEIKTLSNTLPKDGDKVVEAVKAYKKLTKESMMPFSFVKEFSTVRTPNVAVQQLKIAIVEDFNGQNTIKGSFGTLLTNTSGSIDRMLEDIDAFAESVRRKFRAYNVKISGLPGERNEGFKMNLDPKERSTEQKVPLDIQIEGPRNESVPVSTKRRR